MPDDLVRFKKEIFDRKIFLSSGAPVPFVQHGDIGLIETNDANLVDGLRNFQRQRVGGVVEISKETFEELKKNPPVKRSRGRSIGFEHQPPPRPPVAAVAGSNNVAQATLKVPDPKPIQAQMAAITAARGTKGKMSDVMASAKASEQKAAAASLPAK